MAVKLAICCHNRLFSEGLKTLLADERSIKITGEFSGALDVKEIERLAPDIILSDLDTFFDHFEGFLTSMKWKILLIYNTTRLAPIDSRILDLISKGVVGILPAETDSGLLKRALHSVASGELWMTRKVVKTALSQPAESKKKLTNQERKVASYICQGLKNKEIAEKLKITEQTVKSHCNRLFKKFKVTDRLQLALLYPKSRFQ